MKVTPDALRARPFLTKIFATFLVLSTGAQPFFVGAQTAPATPAPDLEASAAPPAPLFHMERVEVAGGAELLTIFGNLNGLERDSPDAAPVPLVSIVRDTLGDADTENDRLRYVWMLTYTRPSAGQRIASAVPFLYARTGNKPKAGKGAPPYVIDLAAPSKDIWQQFFWLALQNIFINPYGIAAKSSSVTFQRNANNYRKAHIIRALAVLSLYEAQSGDVAGAFTPGEMRDIQARLMLTEKTFGGLVDDQFLDRAYQNQTTAWRDTRGHNWELLRQRAEAEGLLFEPLLLPDGEATHAMLWASRVDIGAGGNRTRRFHGRFLNIADPWRDPRLRNWKGYTETRYFDADNRPVAPETPGARGVEMIPLALYGLDHPKIPALLVDFRDGANPKKREAARRVIEDVTRNILALSRFGDLHYLLGRTVFDFITARRGMDIGQPSRLRAYSQLKLLLSLSASLDPELRDEIGRRVERVALNPLENDYDREAQLARQQYAALLDYARRPDGLPAKLARDRRAELVPQAHGRAGRILLRFANVASFGLYTHREDPPPAKLRDRLDTGRRLDFHRRFLREVSKSTPRVEVVWDIEEVRRSLRYVAENGARSDAKTANAAARIFAQTRDEETRRVCLHALYRINNETAKNELLRIYRAPELEPEMRLLTAQFLRDAVREEQRIAPADARIIVSVIGQ